MDSEHESDEEDDRLDAEQELAKEAMIDEKKAKKQK